MAVVTGNDYDHIDIVNGNTQTRHMIKDASARADVEDLKSILHNNSSTFLVPESFETKFTRSAAINPETGANGVVGFRTGYISYTKPMTVKFNETGHKFVAWIYSENSTTAAVYAPVKAYIQGVLYIPFLDTTGHYLRIGFVKDTGEVYTEEEAAATFAAVEFRSLIDEGLTLANVPADAKAVGDALLSIETKTNDASKKLNAMAGRYNLFNKDDADVVEGQFISGVSSGAEVWTTNANFGESGFIPVTPGRNITVYVPGNESPSALYKVYYNSSKDTVIPGGSTIPSAGYVTVPDGVAYMRVAFSISRKNTFMVIELNDDDTIPFSPVAEDYAPYEGYTFPYIVKALDDTRDALLSIETKTNDASKKLNAMAGRYNLFNKDDADVVEGQFISGVSSGAEVWTTNANFGESGFIPVEQGDKITFIVPGNEAVSNLYRVYYDATKAPISGGGAMPDNKYITISSATIKFIRVAFSLARKDDFMVIKLDEQDATPFTPADEIYVPYPNLTLPYLVKSMDEKISNSLGRQWYGKSWFAFGTSITEIDNAAHTGKYVPYLAEMSGMIVTNRGHGGQGIGNFGATSTGANYEAICKLTDGKANADLITLEQGANDVSSAVPLGTIYDTGRETSLAGCLNDCIRYLLENTSAQIVVMNSPYSKTMPALANKVFEWREMMRQICFLNGVHFIDTSCGLGTARVASDQGSNYLVDNIHQTELGGYIYAENIWYKLRNIPVFRTSIPS